MNNTMTKCIGLLSRGGSMISVATAYLRVLDCSESCGTLYRSMLKQHQAKDSASSSSIVSSTDGKTSWKPSTFSRMHALDVTSCIMCDEHLGKRSNIFDSRSDRLCLRNIVQYSPHLGHIAIGPRVVSRAQTRIRGAWKPRCV